MKKQALLTIIFLISIITSAQNVLKSDALYADQTPMEIKLSYSNKEVNKNRFVQYLMEPNSQKELNINLMDIFMRLNIK